MKITRWTMAVVLILLLGARVFGFYQNEKTQALFRAAQAQQQAAAMQLMADETRMQLNRAEADERRYAANGDVNSVLTEGILTLDLTSEELDQEGRAIDLRIIAKAETAYASDRTAQTRTLRLRVWAAITGEQWAAIETKLEVTRFHAQPPECASGAKWDANSRLCILPTPIPPPPTVKAKKLHAPPPTLQEEAKACYEERWPAYIGSQNALKDECEQDVRAGKYKAGAGR